MKLRNLAITSVVLLVVSICIPSQIFSGLWSFDLSLMWDVRLPRVLCAAFAGAAMATAGCLSQTFFSNALATPSVIGVEAAISLVLSGCFLLFDPPSVFQLFALIGTMTGLIYTFGFIKVSDRFRSISRLLLLGFSLNALLGSLTGLAVLVLMERGYQISSLPWLYGSFSGVGFGDAALLAGSLVAAFLLLRGRTSSLDLLSFGPDIAETSGVNLVTLRRRLLAVIALLSGVSISLGGSLPFLGLIAPHICRSHFQKHRLVLISSALLGASITLVCDILSRTLRNPAEIPLGVLTTILGSIYLTKVLWRKN